MKFVDLTNPAENYANYDAFVLYKFRYTFPGQTNETIHDPSRVPLKKDIIIFRQLNEIIKQFSQQQTCGFEGKNSKGEPTYYHCHIHFTSKVLKGTIRKKIDRFLETEGYPHSGIKQISLKPEAFWTHEKIFGYPLKQYSKELVETKNSAIYSKGFSLEQLNDMRRASHQSWMISIEINGNRDNRDNSDTLFERAVSKIDKLPLEQKVANLRQISSILIQLYTDENRPINLTTIQGYTYTLGIKYKVIDQEYLLNKLNI